MDELKGKNIESVGILYENIGVYDKDNNLYYLSTEDLKEILMKLNFTVEKKRVRAWIKQK